MSGRWRTVLLGAGQVLALLATWGVSFVLAIVAYDQTWSRSIDRREGPVISEIERLLDAVRRLEVTANKMAEFQAAAAEERRKLEGLRRLLPETTDAAAVERAVAALAAQGGVRISSFTPGEPRRSEFHARLPLDVELHGPLPGLLELPLRLEAWSERMLVPPLRGETSGSLSWAEPTGIIHVRGLRVERHGGAWRGRLSGLVYCSSTAVVPRDEAAPPGR